MSGEKKYPSINQPHFEAERETSNDKYFINFQSPEPLDILSRGVGAVTISQIDALVIPFCVWGL